jgi:hypothetical protein
LISKDSSALNSVLRSLFDILVVESTDGAGPIQSRSYPQAGAAEDVCSEIERLSQCCDRLGLILGVSGARGDDKAASLLGIDAVDSRIVNWLQATYRQLSRPTDVKAAFGPKNQDVEVPSWECRIPLNRFHDFLMEVGVPIEATVNYCIDQG